MLLGILDPPRRLYSIYEVGKYLFRARQCLSRYRCMGMAVPRHKHTSGIGQPAGYVMKTNGASGGNEHAESSAHSVPDQGTNLVCKGPALGLSIAPMIERWAKLLVEAPVELGAHMRERVRDLTAMHEHDPVAGLLAGAGK